MADREVTPTPLNKKIEFMQENCRVAKFHFDSATTPGMKNYWERIWQGNKMRLELLVDQQTRENLNVS